MDRLIRRGQQEDGGRRSEKRIWPRCGTELDGCMVGLDGWRDVHECALLGVVEAGGAS